MDLDVGAIVDGKVTAITKFGAFVSLPSGKSGMVHISEVAHSFVNDIHEHLTVGQDVRVKVLAADKEGRINLSIKKAQDLPPRPPLAPHRAAVRSAVGGRSKRTENLSFEDKLKQFMQDSQKKMSDMKATEKRSPRRDSRKG